MNAFLKRAIAAITITAFASGISACNSTKPPASPQKEETESIIDGYPDAPPETQKPANASTSLNEAWKSGFWSGFYYSFMANCVKKSANVKVCKCMEAKIAKQFSIDELGDPHIVDKQSFKDAASADVVECVAGIPEKNSP